jgi:glycine hydroxymethyltransferase
MHVIAAKAVSFREALQPSFGSYQEQILKNAKALGEELQRYGFRLVTGGTDNHLLLIDLSSKDLTGKVAEHALNEAGITANKNMIPYDTQKPMITSGIRLGTPALTTRGMKETEMKQVAAWIHEALKEPENAQLHQRLAGKIQEFCADFPLYKA